MRPELTEDPQAAVDAAAADWTKRHRTEAAYAEILDRAQRFAEVLAADEDEIRRAVAAELIAIVGVPL